MHENGILFVRYSYLKGNFEATEVECAKDSKY